LSLTPNTAEDEAARAVRSSDAHDPEAKDSWLNLLSFLSDAELVRYGEIVADQKRNEWRHGAAQRGCAFGAAFVFAGGVWLYWAGYGLVAPALIGATGLAMGYWPYRKAKVRRLWDGHMEAVAKEQQRRKDGIRESPVPADGDATEAPAGTGA